MSGAHGSNRQVGQYIRHNIISINSRQEGIEKDELVSFSRRLSRRIYKESRNKKKGRNTRFDSRGKELGNNGRVIRIQRATGGEEGNKGNFVFIKFSCLNEYGGKKWIRKLSESNRTSNSLFQIQHRRFWDVVDQTQTERLE